MQITGHGMVKIYPPFALKSLAEHLDLRKAFKFKPQVLHCMVSHHIFPMAFWKTVAYEATTNSNRLALQCSNNLRGTTMTHTRYLITTAHRHIHIM